MDRSLFQEVTVDGESLNIPAIIPLLSRTPGRTDWPGSNVGAANETVFSEVLGLRANEIAELKSKGII